MGLDLTLLPFDPSVNWSHNVIQVSGDQARTVFESIEKIPQIEVLDGFNSYVSRNNDYSEPHYGETVKTEYGERLLWTTADHLKPLITFGPEAAYVKALPDHHRIALYWN